MPSKVYFDIGTNLFQGYQQLRTTFSITKDWHIVFVEPNPQFWKSADLSVFSDLGSFSFFQNAICDDPAKQSQQTCSFFVTDDQTVLNRDKHVDQGGSLFVPTKTSITVATLSILELVKPFVEFDEWFFKFDCEGAEFDSIPLLVKNHSEKIKHIVCEFHDKGSPVDWGWVEKKTEIINLLSEYNIPLTEWH